MTPSEPPRSRIDVALPLPVDHTFTYALPEGLSAPPGTRVLVPFRRRQRVGWAVGPGRPDIDPVRPVIDVLDDEPSVGAPVLDLVRWMADYYLAPLGIALRSAVPALLVDASRDVLSLAEPPSDPGPHGPRPTPRQQALLGALAASSGDRTVTSLRRQLGMGSIWPEVRSLRAEGRIRHEVRPPRTARPRRRKVARLVEWLPTLEVRDRTFAGAPKQREAYEWLEASGGSVELAALGRGGISAASVRGLERKGLAVIEDREVVRDPFRSEPTKPSPRLTPNPAQQEALATLIAASRAEEARTFLLHGVTGSGKTLVYIELLADALARGAGAIVLVPEISLTPQTVSRFRGRFGDRVAVLHSALSDGERYDAWRELANGTKRIAVGARSAIFAPVRDLGVIVVDEEHDGSYKQSEAPRYQARDVAVMRAVREEAVCVLGSATPSLESWTNARSGKFELLTLPERATGGRLPPVRVLDMRSPKGGAAAAAATATVAPAPGVTRGSRDRVGRGEGGLVLSEPLVDAVRARLERREQVILLLNRRGYSSFVQCRECGHVWSCADCAVSMTYHRDRERLVCHHCRREAAKPGACERCSGADLRFGGLGTEQVERVVAETFAGARIARMDVDTTTGRFAHHRILGRVERGEIDILLGTQMIAKGLDFPQVTLVGVVNADVGLHLPDFRATERTYQLISQVAGRTGRGPLGGEVLVQTSVPDHYVITCAVDHDFEGFAARELKERQSTGYPPFTRMLNVVVSSPDPEEAASGAEFVARALRRAASRTGGAGRATGASGVRVTGPAPCPIERLHGRWRWHVILRAPSAGALGVVAGALQSGQKVPGGDVRVALDRDPTALL